MLARLLRLAQHTQEWRRLYRGFHIVGGAINCVIIHCISGGDQKIWMSLSFLYQFHSHQRIHLFVKPSWLMRIR